MVFTSLILLGVFNGLVFLPVLLLMFGPPADVVPKDHGDSIDLPTPEPTSQASNRSRRSTRSNPLATVQNETMKFNATSLPKKHLHQSDASLSTIAEESGSYVSTQYDNNALPLTSQSLNAGAASVFVEPEITVETTTHPLVSHMSMTISLVPNYPRSQQGQSRPSLSRSQYIGPFYIYFRNS